MNEEEETTKMTQFACGSGKEMCTGFSLFIVNTVGTIGNWMPLLIFYKLQACPLSAGILF